MIEISCNADLAVIISPGILFAKHHDEFESRYWTHLEAVYGFMIGSHELGPVVGFAQSEDDRHYILGIHFSGGF